MEIEIVELPSYLCAMSKLRNLSLHRSLETPRTDHRFKS